MHSGIITGFRWRGLRQSYPFVQTLESFMADLVTLKRRILTSAPFNHNPTLVSSNTGSGIYGLGTQDPRFDPYVDGVLQLQPIVDQLNAIRLQYLRQQISFKLSTLK